LRRAFQPEDGAIVGDSGDDADLLLLEVNLPTNGAMVIVASPPEVFPQA
jgi:hypothetical protein